MTKRLTTLLAGLLVTLCGVHVAAAKQKPTLLVLPARYTVVQFSFDVAQLRPVYLVAYGDDGDMHVWDKETDEWVGIGPDEYASGELFTTPPAVTVIVGPGQTLPEAVASTPSDSGIVRRIPTLDLKDVVNGLHGVMKFRADEWHWLADRYGFKLKDRNAGRRRWGRYGPPGAKKKKQSRRVPMPAPVPVVETMNDPAPEIEPIGETPAIPEAPAAPAPETIEPAVPVEEKGVPVVEATPVEAPAAPAEVSDMPLATDLPPEDK